MNNHFPVIFFKDQKGNNPLLEYMSDKNETDWNVIINVIQRLSRVGQDLINTDMAKRLDDTLFELRKDKHRILYAEFNPNCFILLYAFWKETKKTPSDCIKRAKYNFSDYRSYENYEEFKFGIDY